MKAIVNGKIITEQAILKDHVIVFDENIVAVSPKDRLNDYHLTEEFDAAGRYVSPGFIDVHVHGCGGEDTMDENQDALDSISKNLLQTGVTSFLPTTMTMPFSKIDQSLKRIRCAMGKCNGAEILGCHMEGPFISEACKGAQDSSNILIPQFSKIDPYLDVIKIITIAPELDDDGQFIRSCVKHGIVVSVGHSNASYEQTISAISAGVSHITHTFNALPTLHHRRPGVVGAALDSEVVCELIADNIHVHPAMQRLLLQVKGVGKIILITDAMRASLLEDGQYDLGGQQVTVSKGVARLADGVIAGSVLSLNKGVKNFMDNSGLCLVHGVQMVTMNPARQIGVSNVKGSIEVGKHADITIFDDHLDVFATFVRGKLLYRRQWNAYCHC